MSRESLVLIIGLVIFLVPGSGLPEEWTENILKIAGVLIIVIGYSLRRSAYYRRLEVTDRERASDSFRESIHQSVDDHYETKD